MAEIKSTKKEQPMLDPIAYRSDYSENNIVGWPAATTETTSKYQWEGTNNVYTPYNKDIKLSWLDPNYQYGQPAKDINAVDDKYITTRNDNIASALYNEWKITKDDVVGFLQSQNNWYNSTEAERANTIDNVWNRLWQFVAENWDQTQTEEKEPIQIGDKEKKEPDLIYWKTTAEEWNIWNGVVANEDAMSIYRQMDQARAANLNALRNMTPNTAAVSTYFGTIPYGDQAMRDMQQFDHEWYQQYQEELNKLYIQDQVNTLTHGTADEESRTIIDSIDDWMNNDIKTWQDKNINDDNNESYGWLLNEKLRSNKTASSAKEQMINIKMDIEDLNSELEELPKKAQQAFKGDVPDYIYQAFIANNSQEIQKKIKNLESKYTALSDIYKTEVWNTQWEMEYLLKRDQYNRELTNDMFDRYYKEAQLELDKIQWSKDANWNLIGYKYDPATNTMRPVTDGEAFDTYNNAVSKVSAKAKSLIWQSTGLQCTWFTNKLTQETAWVTMKNADWWTATAADKMAYATNPNVSDYIPVVWDVAVAVWWPYDSYYGHTMYVDNVWTDDNWEVWFHYIATNDWKNPDDKTIAYEWSKSVTDFYNNYGVWFWNPFKQAQYNNRKTSSEAALKYSPMQPAIDEAVEKAWWKIWLLDNLWNFQEAYTAMYELQKTGQMEALIEEWTLQQMVQMVANDWATQNSGDHMYTTSDGRTITSFFKLPINEALNWLSNEWAQSFWDDEAYRWLLAVMRLIQIKLRDESGAAINQWEWSTDFNLYLPKPWDTSKTKYQKIHKMEEFVRAMAVKCWMPSTKYVQLFPVELEDTQKWKRFYN